jgi:hypothetical protein
VLHAPGRCCYRATGRERLEVLQHAIAAAERVIAA